VRPEHIDRVRVSRPGRGVRDCATLCYMSNAGERPARVGVRELRQNLSVYLRRVKAGESFDVTEHGQAVAQLGPRRPEPTSVIDRMIAEGRITPATRRPRDIPQPQRIPGRPLSGIIRDMRDEDDR
jgi:antitoxin (DNA-binding transcriptional repressor) of toxin-antitoxin stability system